MNEDIAMSEDQSAALPLPPCVVCGTLTCCKDPHCAYCQRRKAYLKTQIPLIPAPYDGSVIDNT